ncbi:hypothetical protein BDF14DRAFT_1753596 [Spinellus fusiger]|nr:hypothetical protein BDF14DRAFT_1753596 [Spinellus fusiger]
MYAYKMKTVDNLPPLFQLPLELFLRVANQLDFDDIFYLATCSRHAKKVAHQLMWYRYNIDLTKPTLNSYTHLIHSAIAFLYRHAKTPMNVQANSPILQGVANRLAVEICDRSPSKDWEPCLDYYLDKTIFIILDHVLLDQPLNTLSLEPCSQDKRFSEEYCPTYMGQLMTNFLATLYPTLTAMFETKTVDSIHHRLLMTHLDRHLDSLIQRYQSYRRSLITPHITRLRSVRILNQSLRHGFRVIVRFIGSLVQTDLLSPTDLHILTQQHITAFFLTHRSIAPIEDRLLAACGWRQSMEEIEFEISVLTDLMQAIMSRQSVRWDSGKELKMFAGLLSESTSARIDQRASMSSII